MKAVVIGCGRVGSNVAKRLAADGWDVTVIDEREGALQRLGPGWQRLRPRSRHGQHRARRAGIEDADAVVVSTNGDNTNIVIGQVAQRWFVAVRRRAPARSRCARTSTPSEA